MPPSGCDLQGLGDFAQRMHGLGARVVKVGEVVITFGEPAPAATGKPRKRTDSDILEHSA